MRYDQKTLVAWSLKKGINYKGRTGKAGECRV